MSRKTLAAPTTMLLVLIFTSLSPMLIVAFSPHEVSDSSVEIDLPEEAEFWPAGARSGATSWLKEIADSDGDTGQWTSSAITDDGTIWVSFYSAAGRDLKVAKWTGWSWEVNDVYTFGDIGKYSEIAIDSNGDPRIASFDITNGVLRISRFEGTYWSTYTVAPGENTGDGNPYSGEGRIGFAIDDSDSEWFSFYVVDQSVGEYILSFANWDSSDSSWAYGVIDDGFGEDSANYDDWTDAGQFSSLQIGANGRPRVAYTCSIVNSISDPVTGTIIEAWYVRSLRYAAFDGAGWSITDIHINESGSNYWPAWWLQLEIDDNGNENIAYQNLSGWDSVRLAVNTGSGWSHSLIANNSNNLGEYIRVESDDTGDLHIVYQDFTNDDLVLMRGSGTTWETVKIDTIGSVGAYADISLNSNAEEIFSYHNFDDSDLIIATPAPDADGDGLADAQDRCMNTPLNKVIDNTGCHYEQQILTSSGSDSQYVDVVKGADGLLRLAHYRGMSDDSGIDCDKVVANNTDDCNLAYRKQNSDGTWGNEEWVDQGGETGRYASIEIAPDGTESIAFHAKTEINSFGGVKQTAAKIATKTGTSWSVTTIAEDNSTGWYTDLAIDSQGNRVVSYTDNTDTYSSLKLARETSPGVWSEEVVQVNGTFAQVNFLNDVAHVSYYSSNPQMIRLAIEDGSGGWDIHNVTTSGMVNSYRLDTTVSDDGRLLINFFRGTDTSSDTTCDAPQECTVQVAEWNGSAFAYNILHQNTDDGISYLSVDIDTAGLIHSVWYNSGYQALQIASPTPTGWETLTLLDNGNGGTYPKIIADENGWENVWYHSNGESGQLREVKRFAWEADHDFVDNDDDQCADTPYGAEEVDMWGCSEEQRDDDFDGASNAVDLCPNTPGHERHLADSDGCSPSQKDSDEDGTNDAQDLCPNTIDLETVDNTGCSDAQRDSDADGVNDNTDQCADTPPGESVDLNGCSASQRDNDEDGVNDKADFMPNDASQHTDSDGDGYGDNPDGTNGDDCPNESGTSTGELVGCPDFDDDGIANDIDDDDDGDGYSDADEIANGTDPLYALDFPGLGEDTTDGNDGTGNDTGDGTGNTDDTLEPGSGGLSTAVIGAIAAVIVLLLIGIAVLALTGGKKDGSQMPAIPSLAQAQAELSTPAPAPAASAESGGQTGEMVSTGNACKHCGAMEVYHIPSYGADYCKACSQYN